MEKIIKLNSKATLNNLKALTTDDYVWSKNKYCPNSDEALKNEKLFKEAAVSCSDFISVVRPTGSGFYGIVFFNTKESTNNAVVLRVPFYYCILTYTPSINYFGDNSIETILPSLKSSFDHIPEEHIDLVYSSEQIEKFIPTPTGEFESSGPYRVALFYYNAALECYIEMCSRQGKLTALGINYLELADNTHLAFKQGAGNFLPDLVDKNGVHYEVKGPYAVPKNFLTDITKNKDSEYILHFTRAGNLDLYQRAEDGSFSSKPIKSIKFDFEYPVLEDEFVSSWDEYWQMQSDKI